VPNRASILLVTSDPEILRWAERASLEPAKAIFKLQWETVSGLFRVLVIEQENELMRIHLVEVG